MSLNFNIKFERKDLWLLAAIMVFLVGVGYVIAYNAAMGGGNPAIMGHSSDEVMVRNKTGTLISLQTLINQSGLGGGGSSITYTNCTWIDIFNPQCNGVPGCSFVGGRLILTMPTPWVVVGGNHNSPDYTDALYVCKINIS